MQQLSLGVVGTSRKADEHRLPIHPAHLGGSTPTCGAGSSSSAATGSVSAYPTRLVARLAACARASSWSRSAT